MRNNGIESLFLDYANFSPDDGVQKFIKDFIYKISPFFQLPEGIKKHFENIQVEASNFENYQDKYRAIKHLEELENREKQFNSKLTLPILKDIFMLVYGSDEGPCLGICPYGGIPRRIIVSEAFDEPENRGCFKCNQLCFKKYLNEIIKGAEYSQMIGLTQFLIQGRNLVLNGLVIELNPFNSFFKEQLKPNLIWNATISVLPLSFFIDMVVSYSLGEFLLNHDRRKLIICQHCRKYTIARKINQKHCSICSKKSIKSKEQRNESQRRWRATRKMKMQSQKYERRIENLMTKLNIPREEAKKYVDADLELERKM